MFLNIRNVIDNIVVDDVDWVLSVVLIVLYNWEIWFGGWFIFLEGIKKFWFIEFFEGINEKWLIVFKLEFFDLEICLLFFKFRLMFW